MLFVNLGVFHAIPEAEAAALTGVTDTMSNQTQGQASNHDFAFTTPSGANEGETITITFPTDFDSSTIVEDDVDILDDAVQLTTAADCSGAEQASVVVAGDVVTITLCAGDGGAIAPASAVEVRLGTNATSSGTGSHQIVNPSSVSAYSLSIGGTFGDTSTVTFTTMTDGTVDVGLVVNLNHSGGGCSDCDGGGGDDDTTAPVISNIDVIDIAETSATIVWDTDELASCSVSYGETAGYGSSASEGSSGTSHSVGLSGLTPDTEYFFLIHCEDASLNASDEGPLSFTTEHDTAPANISGFICSAGDTTIDFAWSMPSDDDLAGVKINCSTSGYPASSSIGSRVFTGEPSDTSTTAGGLSNDTTYYCGGFSYDTAGNEASGAIVSCTPRAEEETPIDTDADGYTADLDCNDTDASIHPGATETCNLVDDNCDGSIDEGDVCTEEPVDNDADNDGYDVGPDCNDADAAVHPGATEICDSVDNNCDSVVDEGDMCAESADTDVDNDGYNADVDCNDNNTSIHPGATETCNLVDDNCDGSIDEGDVCAEEPEIPQGPETEPGTGIAREDISFLVAEETITLAESDGSIAVIPDSALTIRIPTTAIVDQTVSEIYLTIGTSAYLLNTVTATDLAAFYAATITTPGASGNTPLALRLVFADGSVQDFAFVLQVIDLGYTYEVIDNRVNRVAQAVVSLVQSSNGSWSLANLFAFGKQTNPTTSGSVGTFAWYTKNGLYKVEASKAGYENGASGAFIVSKNIATVNVLLTKHIVPPIVGAEETPLPEQVVGAVGSLVQNVTGALQTLRDIPQVQAGTEVIIPTTITLGALSAGVLVTSFNALPFLQYIFTSPFLFFARKRRKTWGVVYNAATKLPIDLAIVRLYRLPDNQLIASRVTDKEGRYFFLTRPGEYRLDVSKPSFVFPSLLTENKTVDGDRLDIYHGENVLVKADGARVAANIPLDPSGTGPEHEPAAMRRKRFLRRLMAAIAPIGVLLALMIAAVRPSWLSFAGLVFQCLAFGLSWRLSRLKKPKDWGIVYADESGHPIKNAIVRIFEPKYNKLLESTITDEKGRYSLLIGPDVYYATYEKPGYEKQELHPVMSKHPHQADEVAIDVTLQKKTNQNS